MASEIPITTQRSWYEGCEMASSEATTPARRANLGLPRAIAAARSARRSAISRASSVSV
jgi:hypothetical protein